MKFEIPLQKKLLFLPQTLLNIQKPLPLPHPLVLNPLIGLRIDLIYINRIQQDIEQVLVLNTSPVNSF